jgi:hypothetical protein
MSETGQHVKALATPLEGVEDGVGGGTGDL